MRYFYILFDLKLNNEDMIFHTEIQYDQCNHLKYTEYFKLQR